MRFATISLLLVTLPGASSGSEVNNRHEKLMGEIELTIVLLAGALPLNSYARYYTEYEGAIHGAYTTEIEERPTGYGCSEVTEDFQLKDVTCPAIADLRPGSRRWVNSTDFPAVGGRNCDGIQIEFNPKTKSFDYLACTDSDY